jgi:hypothetical protein
VGMMVQTTGVESVRASPRDFKSLASTSFATSAHNWCGRRDLNPHNLHRWNLNPVRLPIPPRPHRLMIRAYWNNQQRLLSTETRSRTLTMLRAGSERCIWGDVLSATSFAPL